MAVCLLWDLIYVGLCTIVKRFYILNYFFLSNIKVKIKILPKPTINKPYLNNPVNKNVTNPLYRSLFDFITRFVKKLEFSNIK